MLNNLPEIKKHNFTMIKYKLFNDKNSIDLKTCSIYFYALA